MRRWHGICFADESLVHVYDDNDERRRWATGCNQYIGTRAYARTHQQLVTCIPCLAAMGGESVDTGIC